ncbi:MAG: hypothetical protein ACFWUE_09455 [Xylanivirga thermophila]|jgi:hypothetical protein|uniref:hypothetical protein n=1 Tax=Xylanivirga thermophila TaxID=2496273 RepID=UPI00101D5AD7|nr:hypothetical protein [Xylanivirga thermophila]
MKPTPKTPKSKDNVEKDILGDQSAYGEFVSTFHYWTGLEGNYNRGREIAQKPMQPLEDKHIENQTIHSKDE